MRNEWAPEGQKANDLRDTDAEPSRAGRFSYSDKTLLLPRALEAGAIIGNYRVIRRVGEGGFGAAYEARNIHHKDDRVVLKLLLPVASYRSQFTQMLYAEATALQRVRHDAIVQYRTFGQVDSTGELYLVLEYLDGPTLSSWRHDHAPDVRAVKEGVLRIARGLGAAHGQGIVHRDVSPENIIVVGGELGRAAIIDFSIAKHAALDPLETSFGGKLSWVAPEQLDPSLGPIGPWTDFYALGLVMAFLARGEKLQMGGSFPQALSKRACVPSLEGIPDALVPILAQLLDPAPAKRPKSSEELEALLGQARPAGETDLVSARKTDVSSQTPNGACASKDRSRSGLLARVRGFRRKWHDRQSALPEAQALQRLSKSRPQPVRAAMLGIGLGLLAAAAIALVIDVWASAAAGAWRPKTTGDYLLAVPKAYSGLRTLAREIAPTLWSPVLTTLLAAPLWVPLGLIGCGLTLLRPRARSRS